MGHHTKRKRSLTLDSEELAAKTRVFDFVTVKTKRGKKLQPLELLRGSPSKSLLKPHCRFNFPPSSSTGPTNHLIVTKPLCAPDIMK
jgi:hypothetical protein